MRFFGFPSALLIVTLVTNAAAQDCSRVDVARNLSRILNDGSICIPKGEVIVLAPDNPAKDGFRRMGKEQVDINKAISQASGAFDVIEVSPVDSKTEYGPVLAKVHFAPTRMRSEPSYHELDDRHCVSLGSYEIDEIVNAEPLRGGADRYCLAHATYRAVLESGIGRALWDMMFREWGLPAATSERKARVLLKGDPFQKLWTLEGRDVSNRNSVGFATDFVGDLIRRQQLQ